MSPSVSFPDGHGRFWVSVVVVLFGGFSATVQADDFDALFGTQAPAQQRPTPESPGEVESSEEAEPGPEAQRGADNSRPAVTGEPSSEPARETENLALPDASAEPTPTKAAPRGGTIDEIVVTATKREENVRDVAASIAAFAGEKLENMGVQDIQALVDLVPGVTQADDGLNVKRITIRGISADVGVISTAGIFFGDVPFTDPYLPRVLLDANPFDMATIEILKGPQGTLFGGAGLNGSIRYVPNPARLGEWETRYYVQSLSYPDEGSGLSLNMGAAVNIPLWDQDKAAIRLMGFQRQEPGYVDYLSSGIPNSNSLKQGGYRGLLTYQLTERLNVDFIHVFQKTHSDDMAWLSGELGTINNYENQWSYESPSDFSYTLDSLSFGYQFDWATLESISTRIGKDFSHNVDGGYLTTGESDDVNLPIGNQSDGFVQELRLVSTGGNWNWVAGLFYYTVDQHDSVQILVGESVPGGSTVYETGGIPGSYLYSPDGTLSAANYDALTSATEKAAFGDVAWRPNILDRRLEFNLGLRLYEVETGGGVLTTGPAYASLGGSSTGTEGRRELGLVESGANPKLSVKYEHSDDLMTYLTIARGFRFGGIQALPPGASASGDQPPEVFGSDYLWSHELGLRSTWLDRSILLDATIFYIDWVNPQTYQRDGTGLVQFIDNVGGVESKGIEMAFQYHPGFLPGLSLVVNSAWIKTVTTTPFQTATGNNPPAGSPWPNSPELQVSSTLAYNRDFTDGRRGLLGLSTYLRHTHSSEAFSDLNYTARTMAGQTFDAGVALDRPDVFGAPRLALTITNLTDEAYLVGRFTTDPIDVKSLNRPRAVQLRLSGSF